MKKQSQMEQDIVGMFGKLQEQIISLERKVDTLLGQSLQKPVEAKPLSRSFQQPFPHPVNIQAQNGNRQDNSNRERLMHKAICADCKKQCEVPFRPSEGRPVYCQDCFSRRKSSGSFNASITNRPKQAVPIQAAHMDRLQAKAQTGPQVKPQFGERMKPVIKKKITSNKKAVAKKSKKK